MTRRDDAHIRADHHIVSDVEAAKIIKSAVLIDEDVTPDADLVPARGKERRDQQKAAVDRFADKLAEQRPNFVRVVERQTVESGGDRHRSFDADSGVLLWIIRAPSSRDICYCPPPADANFRGSFRRIHLRAQTRLAMPDCEHRRGKRTSEASSCAYRVARGLIS